MAKKQEFKIYGNKEEVGTFHEVMSHFEMAEEDLNIRRTAFDTADELFRSHIKENGYPYNSVVFDPRTFTFIVEKGARLLANKLRGRMIPREGGDAIGAKIVNEVLSYQWDDNERVDNQSMLSKWQMMDQNARKYGASFGLVKWRHEKRKVKKPGTPNPKNPDKVEYKSETWYDGPNFRPLINRDCLPNPAYSYIKDWFQFRDYVTLQDLKRINDVSRGKPVYKNLDLLKLSLKEKSTGKSNKRSTNWVSKNLSIQGLDDHVGQDEVFKTVEIITEYREDRWITFAPKYGVVLRDIPNPYEHGQIPIVMLKYYPVDDDIYGLSEIEPVRRLQKAANALINQYFDSINMSLYAPLKIRAGNVQMHTIEFGPAKKWIMNNPDDVVAHDQSTSGVSEFTNTYSMMISSMQNALGETSAGISNLTPFGGDKTATEVNDLAVQRNARDNYNQTFLADAIKKQMVMWYLLDRQYLFKASEKKKVVRITGRESIKYFERAGLSEMELTRDAEDMIADAALQGVNVNPDILKTPIYSVDVDGQKIPKFSLEDTGDMGRLIITPDDFSGMYDYVPDIESMSLATADEENRQKKELIGIALNPQTTQQLQAEGFKINVKEVLEDAFYAAGIKDVDKYFTSIKESDEQPQQAGPAAPEAISPNQGAVPDQGMAGALQAMVGGEGQGVVPGPAAV